MLTNSRNSKILAVALTVLFSVSAADKQEQLTSDQEYAIQVSLVC
jgi:hypothetical protein